MLDVITLKKAKISKKNSPGSEFMVLFNPAEYEVQRAVGYAEHVIPGLDRPIMQFVSGQSEKLRMSLFFDTYSAGPEAGGDFRQKAMFAASSTAPEKLKVDVRKYTEKVYALMNVDGHTHMPPLVVFQWGSLKFEGYVVDVAQQFTKFTYTGVPVRAKLQVTFQSYLSAKDQLKKTPRFSPDRTKVFTVKQGDTLTGIAEREYGDAALWRLIADANNIANPRLLKSGEKLEIPALI